MIIRITIWVVISSVRRYTLYISLTRCIYNTSTVIITIHNNNKNSNNKRKSLDQYRRRIRGITKELLLVGSGDLSIYIYLLLRVISVVEFACYVGFLKLAMLCSHLVSNASQYTNFSDRASIYDRDIYTNIQIYI